MINWHDRTGVIDADCPWDEDVVFAELVAKKLDIPFHVVDLSEPYRERVIDYMFSEYQKGRTPNPDVLCNREIKFDAFLEAAEAPSSRLRGHRTLLPENKHREEGDTDPPPAGRCGSQQGPELLSMSALPGAAGPNPVSHWSPEKTRSQGR
jgi:hypothetical protein